MARIGVLAVQGAFAAHARVLAGLGHEVVLVRSPADFERLDGLVLPGGESTTQLKLIERLSLEAPLRAFAKPLLATCAGLVLVARQVLHPEQRCLGLIDVVVARNAWGRQVESFEAHADGAAALPLVFIRAPRIVEVGEGVEVLARFRGEPVLVRQGRILAATCHPELTEDARVHRMAFADAPSAQLARTLAA